MEIEIVGVYPVEEATEPCHLVEISVMNFKGELDVAQFTQEEPGQPRDNWQVPWDEHVLESAGVSGELALFSGPLKAAGELRLVFFFHYLDLSRPHSYSRWPVLLPGPNSWPEKLEFIVYDPP